MGRQSQNEKGFTLLELILVVALLGMLAIIVMPRTSSIVSNAQEPAREGIVKSILGAINKYYAEQLAQTGTGSFPTELDSAADNSSCVSMATGCFENVLQHPLTSADWSKINTTTYHFFPSSTDIVYDPLTGDLNSQ